MDKELIFYLDCVALGVVLSAQYYMIRSAFKAYKHVSDPIFGRCIKDYIQWVAAGSMAGIWLTLSHILFK